ncbi:hypothetical protein YP92_12095 [Salmonella enterica subsp. enterica serovar Newport]|nr:hypothetical protein [Salmonella enterica subsp. enterica serovar Larochelle]ECN0438144.1 hypothetical protein [Salmonella enterica subsp. enterica serovar Newport]
MAGKISSGLIQQVRKLQKAYLKIAPEKMPENPVMARVKKVRKGTKNCANSGTQSAQNEMDRNAQFLREKVRRDKVYRLIYRYELRIVRKIANCEFF